MIYGLKNLYWKLLSLYSLLYFSLIVLFLPLVLMEFACLFIFSADKEKKKHTDL